MARYTDTEQLAGEDQIGYIQRLVSAVHGYESDLARTETERDAARRERDEAQHEAKHDHTRLQWLTDQLTGLAIQIASPSAPRTKGEMARLLEGLLCNQEWQNATWRQTRPPVSRLATQIEIAVRKAFMDTVLLLPREPAAATIAARTLDILGLK